LLLCIRDNRKGLIVLIPDVLLEPLRAALSDMGAEISRLSGVSDQNRPLFTALFQTKVVAVYRQGCFLEIVCRDEKTLRTIQEIVQVLVSDKK